MPNNTINYPELAQQIKQWASELGFADAAVCDIDLSAHEAQLQRWLELGYHGEMNFMAEHGTKRSRPDELVPGTQRVIALKMHYLPPDAGFARTLKNPQLAYISRYALGRDYHKLMRNRIKKLGQRIAQVAEGLGFRPFVDSAPVLERQLAAKAGLGFTGKHSLLIDKQAGSWFFLGELFVDIPLPVDDPDIRQATQGECGSCVACMTMCPTGAIVEPYVIDARKCISYLTIELKGAIPEQYRTAMGNRIYGCDDCQLICPWNRYGEITAESDFHARAQLKDQPLLTLFSWDEETFLTNTEGSPIRRIGHQRWLRNIAIALGNASYDSAIVEALMARLNGASDLVAEHIHWALAQQQQKREALSVTVTAHTKKTQRLIRAVQKGLPRDAE
ncbi:tRNA epoxyqueuosine(34) reductase QueG [Pseudoalteromonas ruthenica]|uniref:tRNA epoxyqueuosine(34) reductase QueG n=1 Tax=Pseudoalteromonas ruthenica TaxID=151081 RepID=UPI00110A3046|nr:tRNA epoxyqueuosine(34) reductase QueG [Pseudoalteromonas ruthenica]TMO42943.1 tRNA epoxyqueuosine(34) reductase QueG [Pseudoalteromonas ruthenica]TMO52172.1 tRNA epoxyqueuosine(34) reductase QueG [Pseudoalteromonas ruthenica]